MLYDDLSHNLYGVILSTDLRIICATSRGHFDISTRRHGQRDKRRGGERAEGGRERGRITE